MRTETITRNIYTFDELEDTARETAREWFRECYQYETWWDFIFDDVRDAAAMLGIDIDRDGIAFSGFSSQGDGAQFTGSYTYRAGSAAAIHKEWPTDTALHGIAAGLQAIQRPWFYGLSATVTHSGHYSHEYDTYVEVRADDDMTGYRCILEADEEVTELLRDFMRWIYKRLESEYYYLMSDESTDENIRCNEYEFYENGTRA